MSRGKFFLFGSRATGTNRPDSDWDVLYVPASEEAPDFADCEVWGQVCFKLVQHLGWWGGVNNLKAEAAELLGVGPASVDLFFQINCGATFAAQLKWDEGYECFAGWLTSQPESLIPID